MEDQTEEGKDGDFIQVAGIPPKIDSWKEVPNEVPRGITGQTNQAAGRSSSSRSEASRVAQLEGEANLLIKHMELKRTGASNTKVECSGSLCATLTQEACPGKKGECYSCGFKGHYEGSTACKPAGHDAKARRESSKPNGRRE